MNFSAWSIHRPLPAILVFILLTAAGLIAFNRLAVSQFPDLTVPVVNVTVMLPGASPSTLETQVTRKVEDATASIPNLRNTASIVNEGVSTTILTFEIEKDGTIAKDEVRDAIDRVRIDLPADVEPPIVSLVNVTGGDMLTYAVTADGWSDEELSWFIDDTVSKRLFAVPGVGTVRRIGGVDREIRVDLRPEAVQGFGVSPALISQQLARIQQEQPGGRTTVGGSEQAVRTLGTVENAADLANFPISMPDGRSVRLSTLATVSDGNATVSQRTTLDGRRVIGFAVQRTTGTSEVDVGNAVRASVAKLQDEQPRVRMVEVASTTQVAENSFKSSMHMLYEGAALAVAVVFLFLRDFRATFISAIALPLSIIPTFAVMYWLGFSLNMITLLALAVVVGILVDDAIVEVENIDRHLRMGKSPEQAALEAADEIGLAVIATSCTLAAVFIPVAFMPGIPGKFFREFGWTAAAAVLFSLLVARLITPMMAAYLLKPLPEHKGDSKLMQWYLRFVDDSLKHRNRTLVIALGIFIGSLALLPLLKVTFIPPTDGIQSNVLIELPPGTALATTGEVAETARQRIADIPEIEHVFVTAGSNSGANGPAGDLTSAELRKATLTIRWNDDRDLTQYELEAQVRERLADLPGVRLSFQGGEPGRALQLVLAGDDPLKLAAAARDVEREIRQLPGLGTVGSSASLVRPEVIVRPDPARAADLGVSTADIAAATRVATRGDYEQFLAKLNLPERQVPIRVQLDERALSDPSLLGQLRVPTATGGSVPLSSVAEITTASGPSQIDRFDRRRNVTITVDLNGMAMGEVEKQIDALPSLVNLPVGVERQAAGDSEIFAEMFGGFAMAMVAGIFCVYGVLLLLFNHASQPITILVAVPLAAGGAFGALLITGLDISLSVLIGLILLIGIAVKNSILLVDYAVMAEAQGMSRHEALMDACHKRARPVIMTTMAMGAGMMPIALGLTADASFRMPMAVAVIGGLITSTVLSLVVVPAAFTLVDDAEAWMISKLRRGRRGNDPATA
ncbi:efflux RND transporter permease subunit [Luteimonas yindakuii]|uniref:Efflux RND transporter permease subunit n=1 Tax=Luteimonas yindakuii TaxID=2565782 RepID=A0A4Z1R4V2_9GAMM|nr:efflux RND transporter permease subunit [Luteimonas yindakuii]TKS53565.1 efflux RND transporter permease subunit [Luteimonas yindakuii]